MLFSILMTQTELYQLLKLPVIFQHFTEHQKHDASISFFDFIAMHYAGDDKQDADQQRDMQLPFKTSDHNVVSGVPFGLDTDLPSIPAPLMPNQSQLPVYSFDGYHSIHASDIWQPPKQA